MQKRILSRKISWLGRITGKLGKIIGSKIHRSKKQSYWGENPALKKTLIQSNFFSLKTEVLDGEQWKTRKWPCRCRSREGHRSLPKAQTTEGLCIDTTVCSDKSNCRRKTAYRYSQNTESTQWRYALQSYPNRIWEDCGPCA